MKTGLTKDCSPHSMLTWLLLTIHHFTSTVISTAIVHPSAWTTLTIWIKKNASPFPIIRRCWDYLSKKTRLKVVSDTSTRTWSKNSMVPQLRKKIKSKTKTKLNNSLQQEQMKAWYEESSQEFWQPCHKSMAVWCFTSSKLTSEG